MKKDMEQIWRKIHLEAKEKPIVSEIKGETSMGMSYGNISKTQQLNKIFKKEESK